MAIFCQINQKNQLVDPNVLYSFDGYQKKGIDPNISGKKSLAHRTFASQVIVVLRCLHTENRRNIFLLSILDLCGQVYT